jgi:hypothetical protein
VYAYFFERSTLSNNSPEVIPNRNASILVP